ncbi:MAG: hypothetical protein ACKE5M_07700 [Methylophilaceae bacterium]
MTSPLENRIKSGLQESVQQLDAETLQRLQSIRREALNPPKKRSWLSLLQSNYWMPATGFAFCSIIAAMLFLPQLQDTNNTNVLDQTAMFELLENPEDLEIISDPWFYLWMDELEAQSV